MHTINEQEGCYVHLDYAARLVCCGVLGRT